MVKKKEELLLNNEKIGDKIQDSLRPSLKLAFILYKNNSVKIYDENYVYLGELPTIKESEKMPEIVDNKKKESVFLVNGLNFDLTYKGEKLASKISGGFFFLYNEKGVDVFEYFTDDVFSGFDEKKELILFIGKNNGVLYGKGFDGRRFELSEQAKHKLIPNNNLTSTNSDNSKVKKDENSLKPEISQKQIVRLLIDRLKKLIKKNKIQADLFISKKLDHYGITETLLKVLDGDLTYIDEEITEASKNGIDTSIKPGFSSSKSALLHELYINTTLTGRGGHRGNNMRTFILDLINLDQYGKLSKIEKLITPDAQKKGIEFFKQLSTRYKEKNDVILKVYSSIKFDDEYLAMINMNKNLSITTYKTFLISKLYEYTTRIDRGNGISIINVSKTIMDIK